MALPHAVSGEVIPLGRLDSGAGAQRTHALIRAPQLEVARLVLPAGHRMPEHAAPGEITLQGLAGRVDLVLGGRRVALGPGDLVHLAAGEAHAVEAIEPSVLLLTLCRVRAAPGVA